MSVRGDVLRDLGRKNCAAQPFSQQQAQADEAVKPAAAGIFQKGKPIQGGVRLTVMRQVGSPFERPPGVLGGVKAGEEDRFLRGEGVDLAVEDLYLNAVVPESGGLQRVEMVVQGETPMDFEDIVLELKRELDGGLHQPALSCAVQGGVGCEASLNEQGVGFGEILRLDEQVEVGELAQGEVGVGLEGGGGAFISQAIHTMLVEQLHHLDQAFGQPEIAQGVELIDFLQTGQGSLREIGATELPQPLVCQGAHATPYGKADDLPPVQVLFQEVGENGGLAWLRPDGSQDQVLLGGKDSGQAARLTQRSAPAASR